MTELAASFLAFHRPGDPLVLANVWDAGSAKVAVATGFRALATTSSGFAATLGRSDGGVSRDEAIAHGALLSGAVVVPVSADLENCFADSPEGVAETVRLAVEAGLAGCSVEDWSGSEIYDLGLARDRVAAAVEAAGSSLVITARAENLIRGVQDLDATIARLQAFAEVGAPVLFAPGLAEAEDIRRVVTSVDRPVNVLARPGVPTIPELASLGVARISVGGGLAWVALGALVEAGRELLERGTYSWSAVAANATEARKTFT